MHKTIISKTLCGKVQSRKEIRGQLRGFRIWIDWNVYFDKTNL